MNNTIIRMIQSMLIGIALALVGYPCNTSVFWIAMVIMALQWLKELKGE